jgi:hypothetical protein
MKNPNEILKALDDYNLQGFSHTNEGLVGHLIGTFDILKSWGCSEDLCIAGLCHSIYGTESYRRNPIELSERDNIKSIIGTEAEMMVYFFGAHVKDSLWENLKCEEGYKVFDRLTESEIDLSYSQLKDLVTLTLANWLEQRPRVSKEYLYLRKEEFLASEKLLPKKAFQQFKKDYGLS